MKQKLLLSLLLTMIVITTACTSPVRPLDENTQVGTMYLAAMIPMSGAEGDHRAIATMTYHGMQRMIELTGSHVDDYVGTINAIPIGDWTIEVRFFDPDGDVTHVATGTARVRPGTPTTLRLEALPLEGRLEVTVDMGSVFAADDIQGARLNFSGNRYTTLDRVDDQPTLFTGGRELPPGDHDFQIALYGDNFNAGSRIYPSPWQTARVYPGKTTHVSWNAQTAEVIIETTFIDFPGPPTDLTALPLDAETIRLEWTPPQDTLVLSYKVYVKQGDLAAYKLVAETADSRWDLPTTTLADEPTWVVVTAVGPAVQESFRSEPLKLDDII